MDYLEFRRTQLLVTLFSSNKTFTRESGSLRLRRSASVAAFFFFFTLLRPRSPERHDPGKARSQESGDEFRGSGVWIWTRVPRLVGWICRRRYVETQTTSWGQKKQKQKLFSKKKIHSSIAWWNFLMHLNVNWINIKIQLFDVCFLKAKNNNFGAHLLSVVRPISIWKESDKERDRNQLSSACL